MCYWLYMVKYDKIYWLIIYIKGEMLWNINVLIVKILNTKQ